MIKKILWFLVGMALIISIPIMLFGPKTQKEALQKAVPNKEAEVRSDKGLKPESAGASSSRRHKDMPKTDIKK
jgi:hypothetical protein